jgi:hypothetical protein
MPVPHVLAFPRTFTHRPPKRSRRTLLPWRVSHALSQNACSLLSPAGKALGLAWVYLFAGVQAALLTREKDGAAATANDDDDEQQQNRVGALLRAADHAAATVTRILLTAWPLMPPPPPPPPPPPQRVPNKTGKASERRAAKVE